MISRDPITPALVTRPLRTSDRSSAVDLARLALGDRSISRKTEEYWAWKHELCPFGASYGVCAADPDNDGIAGLRMLMRWKFRLPSGESAEAARAVDTATHPDYQRRGIFSSLTRSAVDELQASGTAFIFNTPNQNSLPGYLKMGWQVVERWPVYVRVVNPIRAATRIVASRSARMDRAAPPIETVGLTPWARFLEQAGAEADLLVRSHEDGRRQTGFRTARDIRYLDWRYGSHPDVRYGVHALHGSRGLHGFVIARPATGALGLRALVITELFLREPTISNARALMADLRRRVSADYLMAHFADGTIELSAARRFGFIRAPRRGYTWTAKSLNPVELDPSVATSWDLTLGEMEIF